MRRICTIIILLAGGLALAMPGVVAEAAVASDTMGDETHEPVHPGPDGRHRDLIHLLADDVDPATGQATPITRPDGEPLIVGDVQAGQAPLLSDQTQFQRWHVTDRTATFELTYLDGNGGDNRIGFYTYGEADEPASPAQITPLLTTRQDPRGATATIQVGPGRFVGLYLETGGKAGPRERFYSENRFNTDGVAEGAATDHFLVFETNVGLLIAVEDLAYDAETGRIGDQDYSDLLVGLTNVEAGAPAAEAMHSPAPEPATLAVLTIGGLLTLGGRGGRVTKDHGMDAA